MDREPGKGVDHVLDIRRSLPFANLSRIFAEHFLEHLTEEEGARFLRGCFRALRNEGRVRLSTPNLDWVVKTQYSIDEMDPATRREQCRNLNRGFYGWGHRFLYNDSALAAALEEAGFRDVRYFKYGESDDEALRGLEKHETYGDFGSLQHVLIAEATKNVGFVGDVTVSG